jgi:lysophospholipase-3
VAVVAVAVGLAAALLPAPAGARRRRSGGGRTPIVLFPAWHFTRLVVTVPPATSIRTARIGNVRGSRRLRSRPDVLAGVPRRAAHPPLRRRDTHKPMPPPRSRSSRLTVTDRDYAAPRARPRTTRMYHGARGRRLHPQTSTSAWPGYDARPDTRTWPASSVVRRQLSETLSGRTGRRPGPPSSATPNGPIYCSTCSTHTTPEWKEKYIHGFTPLAGNFPGPGPRLCLDVRRLNISDLSLPGHAGERREQRTDVPVPSVDFITSSDPRIFGDEEVVIRDQSTGVDYTPKDYPRSLDDAGCPGSSRSPTSTSAASRSPTEPTSRTSTSTRRRAPGSRRSSARPRRPGRSGSS